MIQKILFLDIDGVLNIMPWKEKLEQMKKDLSEHDFQMALYGLNSHNVENLKLIIDRTQCQIVFSTSWRYFEDHHIVGSDWRKSLAKMLKVSQDIFIDNTPDISFNAGGWDSCYKRRRGLEIKCWIENHTEPGKFKYCVIDDEIVDIISIIPKSHVVHTDMKFGLTVKDVDKAVRILND